MSGHHRKLAHNDCIMSKKLTDFDHIKCQSGLESSKGRHGSWKMDQGVTIVTVGMEVDETGKLVKDAESVQQVVRILTFFIGLASK